MKNLPILSSPKFPLPIFLPTRKLWPTMIGAGPERVLSSLAVGVCCCPPPFVVRLILLILAAVACHTNCKTFHILRWKNISHQYVNVITLSKRNKNKHWSQLIKQLNNESSTNLFSKALIFSYTMNWIPITTVANKFHKYSSYIYLFIPKLTSTLWKPNLLLLCWTRKLKSRKWQLK